MIDKTPKDLEADYSAAGFGNRLGFGERAALLIVDVVMAYLDTSSPLYAGVEAELESNKKLLAAARLGGLPVIFSRVEYGQNGADGGLFYKKVKSLEAFRKGGPLGAFPEDLQPGPDDIIVTKQYASAFFGTSLRSTLTSLGVDTVLITGYSTSGCVRATALDALQNGFIPVVIADACGDRDAKVHESNLFDLAAKYADVVSEQEVLDWMK